MATTTLFCNDYQLLQEKPLSETHCFALLYELMANVHWHEDFYVAFNRRFAIPRLQAWFADEGIQYSYANNLLKTQPWIKSLKVVQQLTQEITRYAFNSVLITYYRNGKDSVGWHADDEVELGDDPVIASLSLGASRTFQYRPKGSQNNSQQQGELQLKNGDLLVMLPNFQKQWQHRIPEQLEVNEPRINLTFRNVFNVKR